MADDGKSVFPVATTFVKGFGSTASSLGRGSWSRPMERGWVTATNGTKRQTGAMLVEAHPGPACPYNTGSRTVEVRTYPRNRRDCTECHTRSAGWSLGPEMAQMNRVPMSRRLSAQQNQIDKFAAARLFRLSPPAAIYKPTLPDPCARASLGGPPSLRHRDRARALFTSTPTAPSATGPTANSGASILRYDTTFQGHHALQRDTRPKGTLGVERCHQPHARPYRSSRRFGCA